MKKILIIINLLIVVLFYSQNLTQSENYIYSRTYLEAVTTDNPSAKQAQSVEYFDGLGRAIQSIAIKASPNGKDIVVPSEYDSDGRQTKSYLPLPVDTQNGAYLSSITGASVNAFYGVGNAYSEVQIEKSPLARTEKSASPGADWHITGSHTRNIEYLTNAGDIVQRFNAVTVWNSSQQINDVSLTLATDDNYTANGYYKANTLLKLVTTDEDGNQIHTYMNQSKEKILVRQINKKQDGGIQNFDTYYVYDNFGNLSYIIPPKAAVSANITELSQKLSSLCYQYKYDKYNRLAEKKIPGKGWVHIVYDKQSRPILVQDANLRGATNNFAQKGWIFTKFDKFARAVYTGFFANTETRAAMQATLNNMTANVLNNETRSSTPFASNGIDVYYTQNAFPTGNMTILEVHYYDEYHVDFPSRPSEIQNQPTLGATPTTYTSNGLSSIRSIQTLPTASYTKNIEDSHWTSAFIWYDTSGRMIGTHSVNHLGGYTRTESLLDFSGLPQKTFTYHARKSNESGVAIKERYVYDTQMRLKQHYHQVDDNPEVLLSEITYNELSQIINKKVGNNLQSIDYTYNIRGWLTDVNENQMNLADLGGKLFAYKIKHNQKDGINNPDTTLFAGKNVAAKYNGSIAEIDSRAIETLGVNPSLTPKRYGYAYDSLNRLVAAYYQNPNNPYSKENTESLSYDLNGNISTLYRTAVMETGTNTATVIDNLSYTYTGNQATKISDLSNNFAGYEGGGLPVNYDENGNMMDMLDKGIFSIGYNYLNLPNTMDIGKNGNENLYISTLYRADGVKLRKESTTTIVGFAGSAVTKRITDYLDGFQYLVTENISTGGIGGGDIELLEASSLSGRAMEEQAFIRDRSIGIINPTFGGEIVGAILDVKTPDLQFFATTEGFYDYQKDQYIYQYRDQLGNIRVSYTRNSTGVLEITDSNDYYAFGMSHLKTGNAYFAQGSYKSYKYNGKELQETGMYDYGWRQYMPDIGRWNGIDKLSEAYSTFSPYAYVANNPINYYDPDGMQIRENSDGYEFTGEDIKLVYAYFTSGGSFSSMSSQLDTFFDGDGSGGGSSSSISSFWNDFEGGNTFGGVSVSGGYLRWWTSGAAAEGYSYINGDKYKNIQGLTQRSSKINQSGSNSFINDWYSKGGKINWFIGATGVGVDNFANRFYIGTARHDAPARFLGQNYYGNGRTFIKATRVARAIGRFSFGIGLALDIRGMLIFKDNPTSPNAVAPAKAGLNTAMGLYGLTGAGTIPSILYFGVDAFYPGGWAGYGNDYESLQSENAAIVPGFITAPYGSQKF